MYKVLIVDDEPLVQVGLNSMLQQGYADRVQVSGTASNGSDALRMIQEDTPDIVITDIKMPVMNGIDLMEASHRAVGQIPVFIMLTAYEEFDLVRKAMAEEAVDYLVKIELSEETLGKALSRAMERVDRERKLQPGREEEESEKKNLEEYRQKFYLKLFNRRFTDEKTLFQEAKDLDIDLSYTRYIAAVCAIQVSEEDSQQTVTLCSSCSSMAKEIIGRYIAGTFISNDLRHFTVLFSFREEQPVADRMNTIGEAILNARTMIENYFNVQLFFGIGTAVSGAFSIPDTYAEAVGAVNHTSEREPVLQFSHIVGANRRSGKDRLIASIQQYINENLDGRLQLSEVAEKFGLSPAYLSVIFKKNTDVGFSEYVNTRKIEKAKQMLLSGDMKIYEVADALGFESAYYFSKVFKKIDGHSPREYIQSKSGGESSGQDR